MGRLGLRTNAFEILRWGEIAKGLVRSVVVVPMGEGVDEGLELVDPGGQVIGGVELVSPARLGAFDATVEVGALGRKNDEFEALLAAMVFEDGHELGSAVELNTLELEGRAGEQLVEQVFCGLGGYGGGDVADCPFGDRVVGSEVLDRPDGSDVDEEGVDLDEFSGSVRLSALGKALGVALARVEAEAPAGGPAPQDRHRNDRAARHQPPQDPPDGRDRDGLSLAIENSVDLALAPHRIVGANRLHSLDEGGRPFRLARALGPARPRLTLFLPAIEARAGDAHGLRCLLGCQAVRHGAAPSHNGGAPSRRFDTWGLRVEKTRRRPTVPDNLPRQAKNLNGGLPRLVDSQLSASETHFPFSIFPSHMYLSPDNGRAKETQSQTAFHQRRTSCQLVASRQA